MAAIAIGTFILSLLCFIIPFPDLRSIHGVGPFPSFSTEIQDELIPGIRVGKELWDTALRVGFWLSCPTAFCT
uniref:Uncharacterized protein n=1 Tax=Anguilla anguilla TaxID=7936 RepID=A0A0E9VF93_ANGAN